MTRRKALLVATGSYEDPRWNALEAPLVDAESLAELLGDREIGGYEVTTVLDQPAHVIQRAIHRFLTGAQLDDELLVYFSCHGIKDYDEQLYFAGTDTAKERELLESYAVPAQFVSRHLNRCRARRKVLLLDCCFSGAFRPGAKGCDLAVDFGDPFAGTGTVVISATDETQLAFEMAEAGSGPRMSVFTASIVEGLRTGRADLDGDGSVSAEELYKYVSAQMTVSQTGQTPKLWLLDGVGSLQIARTGAHGSHPRAAAPVPAGGTIRLALAIVEGITPVAALLRRTLGPSPRPALITRSDGSVLRSTDTVEIVREYPSPAGPAGLGFGLIHDLVERMHAEAGDGAATAAIVFESTLRSLLKDLERGVDPIALSRAADSVFTHARTALPAPVELETKEQVAEVIRTMSGDDTIGAVIAEAMDKVGKDGVVTVEGGAAIGVELELVEGCAFSQGFVSASFITDEDTGEAVLDLPYILLCTHDIAAVDEILPLLERVLQSGRPLLVIAREVTGAALSTLVVNKTMDTFKSVAVRVPSLTSHDAVMLEDIAALTGGEVISKGRRQKLANITLDQLGTAERVIVTQNETTIVGGGGGVDQIVKRIDSIRADIEEAPSDEARERLQSRLARIAGGVAIIRVGAFSEAEVDAKTKQIRNALHSARLAVDSGLVPGSASALAAPSIRQQAPRFIQDPATNAVLETALRRALREPLNAILANCGVPNADRLARESREHWPARIFDARTARFVPTDSAGIWDPARIPWTVLNETAKSIRQFLDLL